MDPQLASATFLIMHYLIDNNKKNRQRRFWTYRFLHDRNHIMKDLASDRKRFRNFTCMSAEDFELILNLIGPKIARTDTQFRKAIPVKDRLAVTLRFLATGDSFTSLGYLFRFSKQSISNIVPEVCRALTEALKNDYVKMPSTSNGWLKVSEKFDKTWNFPHCTGAMDGKHVMLQAGIGSGSEYTNYQSYFSIVLFALVDADYNFIFADVGRPGRISDGEIFKHNSLYKEIEEGTLDLPLPEPLPGREKSIPYMFVADDAFALSVNVMKPYAGLHPKGSPERIFNYHLSRAIRVGENAFGILSSVFRVLRRPMLLEPEKATLVVLSLVYLHNFLRRSDTSSQSYTPPGTFDSEKDGELIPGSWRAVHKKQTSFLNLQKIPQKPSRCAQDIRKELTTYFTTNGSILW